MKKILILHNSYRQAGGEDAAVDAEATLLEKAGHEVHLVQVSNDNILGIEEKFKTFLRAPFDPKRKEWAAKLVSAIGADIVHIHNFFPLLTPAVHQGAAEAGAAVVQTLHNYRLLCANALFLRNGKVCEKCLIGSRAWGVAHKCYRDSHLASLAVVRMQNYINPPNEWQKNVNRFIALTDFARVKFVDAGFSEKKFVVKPNFCVASRAENFKQRTGAIFVGRLSPEKGVAILIEAWKLLPGIKLVIVGDGPERHHLEMMAPDNVEFTGTLAPAEVRVKMKEAECLIMPSQWYEGLPMTLVEAFSTGLPVLASRIGALKELIDDGKTGALFAPGDSMALAMKVRELFSDKNTLTRMSAFAANAYERLYTPQENLRQLEDIYDQALNDVASSNPQ